MQGITIRDSDCRGFLKFDLRDILEVLGGKALQSSWEVTQVEVASGGGASVLEACALRPERISGTELLAISEQVNQVIEGEFRAYQHHDARPWVVVRAVDSSAYDVETDDRVLLEALRRRFRCVADIPE
jgi:hypothetical protein